VSEQHGSIDGDEHTTEGGATSATPAPGASRSAHVAHYTPHQPGVLGALLRPALERIDRASPETQLLVLVPDAESAVEASRDVRTIGVPTSDLLALTSVPRARRMLQQRAPVAIAGTPESVLALVRAAALKLGAVRHVVLAWADEILLASTSDELEAIFGEIAKDADRLLIAQQPSPAVDAFVERHMRRARRVGDAETAQLPIPVDVQYVTAAAGGRPPVLRRLLDELDPSSAMLLADSDASEQEARDTLDLLGYGPENVEVRVSRGELAPKLSLVVLLDLPRSSAELQRIAESGAERIVAIVQPRQLDALRAIAAGGTVVPLPLSTLGARARNRDEQLRAELRSVLGAELAREVLAIEPLLAEYDGVEIAAAAMRLLERERSRKPSSVPVVRAESAPSSGEWTRVFIGVGERDGARPGDVVGAITGEAKIPGDRLGRVDVKDTYTLVEVAAPEAERVARKMDGAVIKGRRVTARIDKGRPGGAPPPRGRDDNRGGPPPRGGRGEGRGRGGPPQGRGDRPGGRRKGPGSDDRPPRADRRQGAGRGDREAPSRAPRAIRESQEWADRADRVRHARRVRPDTPERRDGE
jgi:ATP-dependent RNA helicase DeaD